MMTLTDDNFDRVVGSADTLVLFGSPYCAPCKVMKARMGAIASIFPEVQMTYVDMLDTPEPFHRYGVRTIPTFAAFRGGEMGRSIIGGRTTRDLGAFVLDAFELVGPNPGEDV